MAISGKYGHLKIPKIGDNEPVFVLRAQDKLAAPTIEIYKVLTLSHGCTIAGSLSAELERFIKWTGPRKMPD
jgi:hypothetical protein